MTNKNKFTEYKCPECGEVFEDLIGRKDQVRPVGRSPLCDTCHDANSAYDAHPEWWADPDAYPDRDYLP